MKCEKCGRNLIWRSDNFEKMTTKYKCPGCGEIITLPLVQKTPVLNMDEKLEFKQKKKQVIMDNIIESKKNRGRKNKGRYYYKTGKRSWTVRREIMGIFIYCGVYNTEEQCKKVVRKMNRCNWDATQIPRIRKEVLG